MSEDHSEQLVEDLCKRLTSTSLYQQILNAAANELDIGTFNDSRTLQEAVLEQLVQKGWQKRLVNAVSRELAMLSAVPKAPPSRKTSVPVKDPLQYILKAQTAWEKRMLKSVNTMCSDLSLPLARKRSDRDAAEIREKWTEMSILEKDVSAIRPVYAPKDFLEVLLAIRNPNSRMTAVGEGSVWLNSWGIVQVPLQVKSLQDLRLFYRDLAIGQQQTGVDDVDMPPEFFEYERDKSCRRVVESQQSLSAKETCKRGCPMGMRRQMWCSLLDVDLDDVDRYYFEQLKQNVLEHDLLVDSLMYKDVKLTATNDDAYFVFEDYLYQTLMPFTRDTRVLECFESSSASAPKTYLRGKLGVEEYSVVYPPSGVIPFHGFSMFVCPLCYVIDDPTLLFFVFRELYVRYFHRLHTISSHPQGILGLSILFESLLQSNEPELFFHLKSVGVQPLRLAFKWLMRGFSGYLAPDQILLLWDRVVAFDSLEIFSGESPRVGKRITVSGFTMVRRLLSPPASLRLHCLRRQILFSSLSGNELVMLEFASRIISMISPPPPYFLLSSSSSCFRGISARGVAWVFTLALLLLRFLQDHNYPTFSVLTKLHKTN